MTEDGRRFWSGALKAVGVLIAGLCGACTLVFIAMGMSEPDSEYGPMIATMAVVIGAVPILIGVGLYFWGRSLGRAGTAQPDE